MYFTLTWYFSKLIVVLDSVAISAMGYHTYASKSAVGTSCFSSVRSDETQAKKMNEKYQAALISCPVMQLMSSAIHMFWITVFDVVAILEHQWRILITTVKDKIKQKAASAYSSDSWVWGTMWWSCACFFVAFEQRVRVWDEGVNELIRPVTTWSSWWFIYSLNNKTRPLNPVPVCHDDDSLTHTFIEHLGFENSWQRTSW